MTIDSDLLIEAPAWIDHIPDAAARVEAAAAAAYAQVTDRPAVVAVALLDNDAVQALNQRYRGKDTPTNVLSFPAPPGASMPGEPLMLGDIAVALEVVLDEAAAQNKSPGDHFSHMIVHAVLHLAGFDHIRDDEAETMEALERLALAKLGIGDPYRVVEAADPTPTQQEP